MRFLKDKNTLKTVSLFSTLGLQLGVTMFVFAFFGKKLDHYTHNQKPWWTLFFIIIAMVATIFLILKKLKKNT